MSSLRARLSALVALGLFTVTLIAAIGVVFERWQEDQTGLRDDVELAALRLAEATNPAVSEVTLPAGRDTFAVLFDGEGRVIDEAGPLPDAVIDELLFAVFPETTSDEILLSVELNSGDDSPVAAGAGCTNMAACDTAVVGASEERLGSYLGRHLGWILGFAIGAGAVGALAARWLVTRSLLPVDRMRTELDAITASHITTADLQRRVPVPASGDELTFLGESMNATLDRLGSAVTANERFVADAAHELRSPITGVKAALEVERAKNDDAGDSILGDSITELDRAGRLVDDLLVLARRQSGMTHHQDVDLDDIVRAAVANLRAQRPDLHLDVALGPCRVRGNPDELRRVVTNLLDNAAHYGNGRIAVSTIASGRSAVLIVADDGPGIEPKSRQVVFDRFARLDESRARATGGSGLGLAIAKELIEDHGGTITVTDAELGGAAFEMRLPVETLPSENQVGL